MSSVAIVVPPRSDSMLDVAAQLATQHAAAGDRVVVSVPTRLSAASLGVPDTVAVRPTLWREVGVVDARAALTLAGRPSIVLPRTSYVLPDDWFKGLCDVDRWIVIGEGRGGLVPPLRPTSVFVAGDLWGADADEVGPLVESLRWADAVLVESPAAAARLAGQMGLGADLVQCLTLSVDAHQFANPPSSRDHLVWVVGSTPRSVLGRVAADLDRWARAAATRSVTVVADPRVLAAIQEAEPWLSADSVDPSTPELMGPARLRDAWEVERIDYPARRRSRRQQPSGSGPRARHRLGTWRFLPSVRHLDDVIALDACGTAVFTGSERAVAPLAIGAAASGRRVLVRQATHARRLLNGPTVEAWDVPSLVEFSVQQASLRDETESSS